MSPAKKPRVGPVNVRLIDLPAKLAHQFQFSPDIGFPKFLSLLTEVSAHVAQHIQGVARRPSQDRGFTTSEGPWWYRIARYDGSYKPANREDNGNTADGAWRILNTNAAYDFLVAEITLGLDTEGGWVEVEHAQQKTRDEQALQNPSPGLALIKDTVRAGYESRITSGEFQDVEENPEIPVIQGVAIHHRHLSDVTEVPSQPTSGYLYPQPNSAPHTPYPPRSPLFDLNLRGPLTSNSLPVKETSSNFIGGGNTAHHVIVTSSGQTIVTPFPLSPSAIPGSDHLLGATAHYESRETKVQLPTVVDGSVIREADTFENVPVAETGPPSTTPQVAQGQFPWPQAQSPYLYGPHGNFAPFGSFAPQDVEDLHSNLAQDNSRHQGPPHRLFGSGRQEDQYRVDVPDNSINRWNQYQRRGQRDGQDRSNGNWNANRGRGHAKNPPLSSRGAGARGGHQSFRGQNAWSHGQSRNHVNRGSDHPFIERSNPPFQGLLPPAGSGLPSRPNTQYPPVIQPHMHPMGYQYMMPPGRSHPFTYGYGHQLHYPPPEQDWTSIPGVNTDLMTESEIISLNRQRFAQGHVQTSNVTAACGKPQPAVVNPPPAVKADIEGKMTFLTRPTNGNDPMPVRDIQTALDVTVTDPYLSADAKNTAAKVPVTKLPNVPYYFGTAPHVEPMNLRGGENSPASVASATAAEKRKATRRANQAKAKANAKEEKAAKEDTRSKQNNNRAIRAQRRENKIFGSDAK